MALAPDAADFVPKVWGACEQGSTATAAETATTLGFGSFAGRDLIVVQAWLGMVGDCLGAQLKAAAADTAQLPFRGQERAAFGSLKATGHG